MVDHNPPSATSMLIGTAIVSIAAGYMLGMASSFGYLPNPFAEAKSKAPRRKGDTSHYDDEEESSEEELDDGVIIDHAPNWANGEEADKRDGLRMSALEKERAKEKKNVAPTTKRDERNELQQDWDLNEECKLVLVVRTDLGMTKGTPFYSVLHH